MDLLNIVLAVLGTAVSILLFVIAHRQTIGARQERVRTANDEIEKILVRRIGPGRLRPKPRGDCSPNRHKVQGFSRSPHKTCCPIASS